MKGRFFSETRQQKRSLAALNEYFANEVSGKKIASKLKQVFLEVPLNIKTEMHTEEDSEDLASVMAEVDKAARRIGCYPETEEDSEDLASVMAEVERVAERIGCHLETEEEIRAAERALDEEWERINCPVNRFYEEKFFYNKLGDTLVLRGMHFDSVERWSGSAFGGHYSDGFAAILKNDSTLFIIDKTSEPDASYVERLLTTRREGFDIFFSNKYDDRERERHWGIAVFTISEEVKEMALENGLTILQRKGDELVETYKPGTTISDEMKAKALESRRELLRSMDGANKKDADGYIRGWSGGLPIRTKYH